VTITNREAGAVHEERREQLVEEIRTAERARELLAGLERRLKERNRSDLEEHLGHLERLAGSLPEAPHRAAVGRLRCQVRQDSRRGLCLLGREQVPLEDRGEALYAAGLSKPPGGVRR
jgi:hypothetical protein